MPEVVTIKEKFQLIRVKSVGDVTINDLKHSLSEIIKLKKESGFTRVLVDHRKATSLLPAVPTFNFGAEIGQLLQETSIALLVPKRLEDEVKLFRDAANARGGNVHIFNKKKSAIQWLTGQQGET